MKDKINPMKKASLDSVLRFLGQAKVATVFLPLLMVILIIGTIAQKYMGLYAAQKIFFYSFFFWWGFIPLPGALSLLAIILISLTVKFIFYSKWSMRRTGINLAHLGVLILLYGGIVTAVQKQEGALTLFPNQAAQTSYDFHKRSLRVLKDGRVFLEKPFDHLELNTPLEIKEIPFKITIKDTCRNCAVLKRDHFSDHVTYRTMAKAVMLQDKKLELQDEKNLSGLGFEIQGLSKKQDGYYVTFDVMPNPLRFPHKSSIFQIDFSKTPYDLPFKIRLKEFKIDFYPGTEKAKSYQSNIIIEDGSMHWPALVEMNKPLRYKGYTLFQSSYITSDNGETASVLAVVKDAGWLFPYWGATILSIGLLIHFILAFTVKKKS
jgi:hypothetical protein